MEETLELQVHGESVAAPIIFIIVLIFQFLSRYLENVMKVFYSFRFFILFVLLYLVFIVRMRNMLKFNQNVGRILFF